ncbi:hypothetical protein B0T13DRAFT_46565 [Neurospora crassa]|nr:hypothetical protein B0T13DRAFT_46565 [Neurospora crassa]
MMGLVSARFTTGAFVTHAFLTFQGPPSSCQQPTLNHTEPGRGRTNDNDLSSLRRPSSKPLSRSLKTKKGHRVTLKNLNTATIPKVPSIDMITDAQTLDFILSS